MHLAAIRQLLASELDATKNLIEASLNSDIKLIPQVAQHLIDSGGKRLRPLVVLLSAKALAYNGTYHVNVAAIIELIHTATLLHDDVVDASALRRGQSTANAVWGNAASVLVGDFLYSRAFQMMVAINNMRVMQILADATNEISQGEILQLLNCRDPEATEARYMQVIQAKTGVLFATAAQLGAVLANQDEQTINALYHYGLHLGVAFQLTDDVLDYSTSSQALGKNPGDDLAEGNPTLPLIYAMHHGTPAQATLIREAIAQADRTAIDSILQAIESTGAIAYTYRLADEQAKIATQYLEPLPASPYRDALTALAKFAVKREG